MTDCKFLTHNKLKSEKASKFPELGAPYICDQQKAPKFPKLSALYICDQEKSAKIS